MAHTIILADGNVTVTENVNLSRHEWRTATEEDGVQVALLIEDQKDLDDAREIQPTPGCEEYNFAAIREAAKKINFK